MSGYAAWVVGIVLVVALAVGLDRLVATGVFDRRPRERPRPTGSSAATGALGDLVEIFQPSRVHLTEELERQRLETDLVGDSAPPIDLDGGVVHLPAPAPVERPRDDRDAPSAQIPAPGSATASGTSATDVGAGEANPTTNPPGAST